MQKQLIDNTIPGCYYDKKRDSYYIKYKGITRRGLTKKEAERYSYELRQGYITIDQIDKEKHPEKCLCVTNKDTEKLYDIADLFLEKKMRLENTYGTYAKAKFNINNRIKLFMQNKMISEMTDSDCSLFKERLSKEPLSTEMKNYNINMLKRIVHYGMKINHIKEDPTEDMEPFKKSIEEKMKRKEKSSNIWSVDEFNEFISLVKEDDFKSIKEKASEIFCLYIDEAACRQIGKKVIK